MQKDLQCPECKNMIPIEAGHEVEDVIECPMCGIELEVVGKDDEGNLKVEIIEEEK